MTAAANTLTIDASALNGINLGTYITDYFAGLQAKSAQYFGGTPDVTQMGTFYVNGTQVLNRYDVVGTDPLTLSTKVVIVGGEGIAYDFFHSGTQYGHGITGHANSLTFGTWVDGVTTGTRGIGAAGEITGLETGLTITGFNLTAAVGAGIDPLTNLVQALYNGARNLDAALIYGLMDDYSLSFQGSEGADTVTGYGFDDQLLGAAGNDVLKGIVGDDSLDGGQGDDQLVGGAGVDILWGQGGVDTLNGGAGDDWLAGHGSADVLKGGAGNDTLSGGFGADRLTGGTGQDLFVFKANGRLDIVTDFTQGQDILDVSALDLSSLDDFRLIEKAGYVELKAGTTSIRLLGVEADDLSASDFLF